jgi:hypothetical protein
LKSAENEGAVDPILQATTGSVKEKGVLLEEEEYIKPRQPVDQQISTTAREGKGERRVGLVQ